MKLKYSLFALIALAVSGCQKAPVYDDVVYIAGAEGEVPTLSLTLDDQFPKELSVKVSSSIVVGHDTKVRLVTDPSKIEEYNTQYGKKGVMLPETNFVLKNTELTIPAGSFSAAEPLVVSVTKDEGLKEGVSYVIPLSIESVDGDLKVKEGFRTVFVEIGRRHLARPIGRTTCGYLRCRGFRPCRPCSSRGVHPRPAGSRLRRRTSMSAAR